MRIYRGSKVCFHSFLISALDGDERLNSCPGHFTPDKGHQYRLNRRLSGPQSQSEKNILPLPRQEPRLSIPQKNNCTDCVRPGDEEVSSFSQFKNSSQYSWKTHVLLRRILKYTSSKNCLASTALNIQCQSVLAVKLCTCITPQNNGTCCNEMVCKCCFRCLQQHKKP